MDTYVTTLTVLGIVILFTAWLPMVLHRLPISLPIICIIFGALWAWSPFSPLPGFNPLENRYLTERLTELVVIVALMGAGPKIDRTSQPVWLISGLRRLIRNRKSQKAAQRPNNTPSARTLRRVFPRLA